MQGQGAGLSQMSFIAMSGSLLLLLLLIELYDQDHALPAFPPDKHRPAHFQYGDNDGSGDGGGSKSYGITVQTDSAAMQAREATPDKGTSAWSCCAVDGMTASVGEKHSSSLLRVRPVTSSTNDVVCDLLCRTNPFPSFSLV
jgi:hypothetical protein